MTAALACSTVPVIAAPMVGGRADRIELNLGVGKTIAQMIAVALPALGQRAEDVVRVTLHRAGRMTVLPPDQWQRWKPKAGTYVVIQVLAGKDVFKTILSILVAVAAAAIASFFFPGAVTGLAALGKSALTIALTTLGGILIGKLFQDKPKDEDKPTYAATGWRNPFNPDGAVPAVFGFHRFAPPFAAPSHVEIVGDQIFLRGCFELGYGTVEASDFRFGDTGIDTYKDVTVQQGTGPLSLYPGQVIEERVGTQLKFERPRDAFGEFIAGAPPVETPVMRETASDALRASLIWSFPKGLKFINDKGKETPTKVDVRLRWRLKGASDWAFAETVELWGDSTEGIYRQHWLPDFPTRGTWQIDQTLVTPESDWRGWLRDCFWMVAQSHRPEAPFNVSTPMHRVAFRIRSSFQLQGDLDNFNCLVKRVARDWDAGSQTWVTRATRDCAAGAIWALQGPANPKPEPDERIDWPAFEAWAEYCKIKGLTYSRVHDGVGTTLGDVLGEIGAAGRAAIFDDGVKITVVIDRKRDLVAEHINARNCANLRAQPSYFRPPDAIRVQFLDETNDYKPAVRIVPWPAKIRYETLAELEADLDWPARTRAEVYLDEDPEAIGYYEKIGKALAGSWVFKPILRAEEVQLPGVTHPDNVWVEARRRQHETMLRNVNWSATKPGILRPAGRGDLVMISRDVVSRWLHCARVKAVKDNLVLFDDAFRLEAGKSYAIRFRLPGTEAEHGASVTRTIATVPGRYKSVRLTGGVDIDGVDANAKPGKGTLVHFGPAGQESYPAIVTGITRTTDMGTELAMSPAADELHDLVDAEVPPPWTGRVGLPVDDDEVPAVPIVYRIASGTAGTGNANGLHVYLRAGLGSAAFVWRFEVRHRKAGEVAWREPTAFGLAAGARVGIGGYVHGNTVELAARSLSTANTPGDWGAMITVTIGQNDFRPPSQLDFSKVENSMYATLI